MRITSIKISSLIFLLITLFGLNIFSSVNVRASTSTYYVDQANGDDNFDGLSEDRAFKGLQPALSEAKAGDTVLVKKGTYSRLDGIGFFFKFNGTPSSYITLKNFPGQRPKLTASSWCVFCMDEKSYITIEGFEMTNSSIRTDDIDGAGLGIALNKGTHHIIVENNVIHDTGGSGVQGNNADYVTINNNTIYNTSKESRWGTSGINLNHNANWDDHPGTDYNNVITNNVVYGNEQTRPSYCCGGDKILDGNGIILDKFKDSIPYTGRTLIANNLVVRNGGRGINIYRSVNTDVINNTLFKNSYTPVIGDGDLTSQRSINVRVYNNLIQSRDDKHCGFVTNNQNVSFDYNLCFSKRKSTMISPNSIQSQPKFRNPSSIRVTKAGFELSGGTAAINAADPDMDMEISKFKDLAGKARISYERIDIGALEYKHN